jgi:hypothetical protein
MHQKSNHCTKSNSHVHVRERFWHCRIAFVHCSYFETGFSKPLRFIVHKYAISFYFTLWRVFYTVSHQNLRRYIYCFKNNDIPGREICTLSFLMSVSSILQLFSLLSLNVTILCQIYGGILDNLSMPSILVHVLVYFTTKSTMTEIAAV